MYILSQFEKWKINLKRQEESSLPIQGAQVQSLVREDPTWHGVWSKRKKNVVLIVSEKSFKEVFQRFHRRVKQFFKEDGIKWEFMSYWYEAVKTCNKWLMLHRF